MTTLSDLRNVIRLTLADETTWPDAALDGWIADALRFYSAEFPRSQEQLLELSAGTRVYDLPDGCLDVTGVAYPAAEEPPRWLAQVSERDRFFLAGGAAYALRASGSAGAPGRLVLAETPADGESALVTFLAGRAIPAAEDDDAVLDAPDAHMEALIAFCEFRAHWERETAEAVSLETVSLSLAQIGENARRAWNRYREVIARLQWLAGGGSAVVGWGSAGAD